MDPQWYQIGYLLSASFFIFGLKMLGHPRTAPRGNQLGALGMLTAVVTVLLETDLVNNPLLIVAGIVIGALIGAWLAVRVEMTGMPELVALFNGFGGAASALVALAEAYAAIESGNIPEGLELHVAWVAIGLSALVGWMTLTGSLVAYAKLKGGFMVFGKWRKTPTWGPS